MRYLLVNYVKKADGKVDEIITVSKKISQAEYLTYGVILDYKKKKVAQCLIDGKVHKTDWDRMNEYYKKVYPTLIEQLEKA